MVRKTRRASRTHKNKHSGINSIPELRRAFEYIEEYVDAKIDKHESKEHIAKDLRKEWYNVFAKELNKASSDAFVLNRAEQREKRSMRQMRSTHRTIRRKGGAAIQGAPLDYATRAGTYLAPGQIPVNGHLPTSNGAPQIGRAHV